MVNKIMIFEDLYYSKLYFYNIYYAYAMRYYLTILFMKYENINKYYI